MLLHYKTIWRFKFDFMKAKLVFLSTCVIFTVRRHKNIHSALLVRPVLQWVWNRKHARASQVGWHSLHTVWRAPRTGFIPPQGKKTRFMSRIAPVIQPGNYCTWWFLLADIKMDLNGTSSKLGELLKNLCMWAHWFSLLALKSKCLIYRFCASWSTIKQASPNPCLFLMFEWKLGLFSFSLLNK